MTNEDDVKRKAHEWRDRYIETMKDQPRIDTDGRENQWDRFTHGTKAMASVTAAGHLQLEQRVIVEPDIALALGLWLVEMYSVKPDLD